ncbi:uncharacterized protein [Scyliorhinus torazame]|uniref:uncharacterized protein n=1 Tax=Scyliorhinus torazame TaxID=75743 RepID=UPI003B59E5F5
MEACVFVLCCGLVHLAVAGNSTNMEKDEFYYDYETLRIGGLVFAVVLFTLGILLILSRKCRCSFNQKARSPGDEEAQAETLITNKGRRLPSLLMFNLFLSDIVLHPARVSTRASISTQAHRLSLLLVHLSSTMTHAELSDTRFTYDYESVRKGGLIFAVAAFFVGVAIILSRRFRCRGKTHKRCRLRAGESILTPSTGSKF